MPTTAAPRQASIHWHLPIFNGGQENKYLKIAPQCVTKIFNLLGQDRQHAFRPF